MKTRGVFWSDFPPLSFGIFFWVITSISKPDGSGWKRRLWPCFSWYGALILWPWWSVMAILMEQVLVSRREVVWRKARPAIANTRLELWGCPVSTAQLHFYLIGNFTHSHYNYWEQTKIYNKEFSLKIFEFRPSCLMEFVTIENQDESYHTIPYIQFHIYL